MDLASEQCVAYKTGEGKLSTDEVIALLDSLNDWLYDGGNLVKSVKFANFMDALAYINRIAPIAEEQDHHPDIGFGWGYATIRLSTHSAGGVSRNDFITAAKIDALG